METSYSCNKNVTFSLVGGFPKTPPQNPPFHRQSYIRKSSSPGPEARSTSSFSGAHVLFLPTHKFGLWWLTGPLQIIWLWVYGCAFLELSTVFAFTSEWERVRGSLLDLTSLLCILVSTLLHVPSLSGSHWSRCMSFDEGSSGKEGYTFLVSKPMAGMTRFLHVNPEHLMIYLKYCGEGLWTKNLRAPHLSLHDLYHSLYYVLKIQFKDIGLLLSKPCSVRGYPLVRWQLQWRRQGKVRGTIGARRSFTKNCLFLPISWVVAGAKL